MNKKNEDVGLDTKLATAIASLKANLLYQNDIFPTWTRYRKDVDTIRMLEWILEELEKE